MNVVRNTELNKYTKRKWQDFCRKLFLGLVDDNLAVNYTHYAKKAQKVDNFFNTILAVWSRSLAYEAHDARQYYYC